MAGLTVRRIEALIYPVSFYRHKARHVKATCRMLVERFGGRVPTTMEELLTLPGVGRKTANLVLILAFKSRRNICVDTHVHRISNRLGWVRTRTPDETEQALYRATADGGGRTSTCISSRGGRTCAGRLLRGATRARSALLPAGRRDASRTSMTFDRKRTTATEAREESMLLFVVSCCVLATSRNAGVAGQVDSPPVR